MVYDILRDDKSGHDISHIRNVLAMSLKFADSEGADKDLVSLIALLHDVDDYKLFGYENSANLTNARRIMDACSIDADTQKLVCNGISTIGYSKRLKGTTPNFLEAMIVSDADMCDALGASGIIRTHTYATIHGRAFFYRDIHPIDDMTASKYTSKNADTTVCHFFEKLLRLKNLMLTESGMREAQKRHQFIADFLYEFFEEEDCPEWRQYLDKFLESQDNIGNKKIK